eukprot:TRINITY_DN30165_c0_g1_i1.p1 TRINITY_DN30165_c0_g1~~TRINITY_DN30165_c0_g1_i1.p1  ORF type:complete len:464 (+),score=52.95 TRINITY_DN30165_c0_g1_i1:24-1394(+)
MPSLEDAEHRLRTERAAEEAQFFRRMEQHPRCALLAAPEFIGGEDKIATDVDHAVVKDWLKYKLNALNLPFFTFPSDASSFTDVNAVSLAFYSIQNTADPACHESLIWYYTGHGRSAAAQRPGELSLLHKGWLPLKDLVSKWLRVITAHSINCAEPKSNKHLIVVLDSCFSGKLAELTFEDPDVIHWMQGIAEMGCSLVVQAASDQLTYSGYFTPVFVALQDPAVSAYLFSCYSQQRLDTLGADTPTPGVWINGIKDPNPVIGRPVQNGEVFLFGCPKFFAFCAGQLLWGLGPARPAGPVRPKPSPYLQSWLEILSERHSDRFSLVDYKLMGHPMALILLRDSRAPNSQERLCVHIHFAPNSTHYVTRINFASHTLQNGLWLDTTGARQPLECKFDMDDTSESIRSDLQRQAHRVCNAYRTRVTIPIWGEIRNWDKKPGDLGAFGLMKAKQSQGME